MERADLFGIPIHLGPYRSFADRIIEMAKSGISSYVCVLNVHMLTEGFGDKQFGDVIRNASLVTPDGKPICWALKLMHNTTQDRVAGMDLLPDLLTEAVREKLPVFFYGGSTKQLEATRSFLSQHYPGLEYSLYSPPFRPLTVEEDDKIVERIRSSRARLIFAVLGCPKQEKWMASMNGRINGVMVGIGGALPVMVGLKPRAPSWMQSAGLEWFYRLAQEPRRLFKRYAVTNSLFLFFLAKALLRKRFA